MKNVIVVADWFMSKDDSMSFLNFIAKFEDVIESIYFNGEFYSVENTLKNFAG